MLASCFIVSFPKQEQCTVAIVEHDIGQGCGNNSCKRTRASRQRMMTKKNSLSFIPLFLLVSSIPSPVYQWRKALRRNIMVNCAETRWNISWMQVEFPTKVVDILRPLGGMSQTADLMLLGIHSTKYEEFLFWTLSISSSTSLVDMRPRNMQHAVR